MVPGILQEFPLAVHGEYGGAFLHDGDRLCIFRVVVWDDSLPHGPASDCDKNLPDFRDRPCRQRLPVSVEARQFAFVPVHQEIAQEHLIMHCPRFRDFHLAQRGWLDMNMDIVLDQCCCGRRVACDPVGSVPIFDKISDIHDVSLLLLWYFHDSRREFSFLESVIKTEVFYVFFVLK